MAEIRVELRDFTDNVLGSLDITSSDDFPLSLNYQNFDIRDFNSRNGSFSKTFKVPATRNNNKLFNHIYKDGNVDTRKVRKDIPSSIYVDNLPIINGTLRITKITSLDKVLEYDCLFFGDNMDWANAIKEKDLKDLEFSSSSYTPYLPTNITPFTFENPQGISGSNFNQGAHSHEQFSDGQDKLVYPLVSAGEGDSSKNQVLDGDFIPCLYLKNIWDKIFADAEYEVQSTFCDSDFFKSLIVPLIFQKNAEVVNEKFGKISRETDEDLTSEIGLFNHSDGTQTLNRAVGNPSVEIDEVPFTVHYVFGGDSSVDAFGGGNTSTTTGNVQNGSSGLTSMLVKNAEGEMNIKVDIDLEVFGNEFSAFLLNDQDVDFQVQGFVGKVLDDDDADVYDADNVVLQSDLHFIEFKKANSPETRNIPFTGTKVVNDPVGTKYVFYIYFRLIDYASFDAGSVGLRFKEGSSFEIYDTDDYEIDDEIGNPAFLLPQAKQSEFVSGVAQLFNLQFKTDPIAKIVYIEPYDHFYESTSNAVDWSDKIDYSKNIDDEFIYDIKSKIILKYKDASSDAFLERFNKKNFVDWGAYEELDDTGAFFDGEYTVENKFFSPTFNFHEREYIDETANHSIIRSPLIPIYHSDFTDLSKTTERPEKEFDIGARILLLPPRNATTSNENLKTVMYSSEDGVYTGYSYAPENNIDADSSFNRNFARGLFINIDNLYYDFDDEQLEFAKLNNGYEDVDLNLSFSDVKYDVTGSIDASGVHTIRGLYFYYYNRMINQLKQKPKIKNLYINLDRKDIALLDFQKLVFINGVYYRINKVIDFKPQDNKSTRVELTEYYNLGRDATSQGEVMDMINGIDL